MSGDKGRFGHRQSRTGPPTGVTEKPVWMATQVNEQLKIPAGQVDWKEMWFVVR